MGEMQLLSVLISSKNDDLLFTGDKRFLKALAKQTILEEKLSSVEHRFISFEHIVMLPINALGFDKVQGHVITAHSNYSFDKTIRCCFEGLPDAQVNSVCTNIRREILRVTSDTGNLLCSEAELYSLFPSECNSGNDNYDFLSDFISIPQS
ncbi:hypothetical protein ACPUVO_00620 [Pseudocolwellia sp. HL-MZ19]|uniref:hypothetical protein n=1 Tax=Pseudocolwellia sp. HL-MZ19 TaxID=3400846 RepID=UPI003CF0EED1